jgi:hypothetical protein
VILKSGTAGGRPSLSLTRKLRGRAVECSVTATNSGGSATANSRPFKIT